MIKYKPQGNCLDFECPNCKKPLGDHNKFEADKCSNVLFIYYKGLELLSK